MVDEISAEEFWSGPHGAEYLTRNDSVKLLERNRRFFEMTLLPTCYIHPQRVIEFGANIGMNLRALRQLNAFRLADFTGVDINKLAVAQLERHGFIAHHADIARSERPWGTGYDFTLAKGICIHIHPDKIRDVYATIYDATAPGGLIYLCEYFAASRRQIEYRGFKDKLWLADYGSELWDQYPDLEFLGAGFAWKRDPVAAQDDITHWLFRRKGTGE